MKWSKGLPEIDTPHFCICLSIFPVNTLKNWGITGTWKPCSITKDNCSYLISNDGRPCPPEYIFVVYRYKSLLKLPEWVFQRQHKWLKEIKLKLKNIKL